MVPGYSCGKIVSIRMDTCLIGMAIDLFMMQVVVLMPSFLPSSEMGSGTGHMLVRIF
jgi:hypothetical protein